MPKPRHGYVGVFFACSIMPTFSTTPCSSLHIRLILRYLHNSSLMMSDSTYNHCTTCGACCQHYRVSFHWSETDPALGGIVPAELTEKINDHRVAMKGTSCKQPRCVSLHGEVGKRVSCTIYPQRSSSCREFAYSWENNQPEQRCDEARAAHGLPLLLPQAFELLTPAAETSSAAVVTADVTAATPLRILDAITHL